MTDKTDSLFHATGRRKTSIARIWMRPGKGEILINKKSVEDYFCRESLTTLLKQPLTLTNTSDKYDIKVNVKGGGISGQAGAVRHGITRALVKACPECSDIIRKHRLLTRDSRMKERKKYGQKGARARFQFSKR
ncbi:MAG: 30S ribosomal protein S9 [Thermodesulfobacteriota bacterium]